MTNSSPLQSPATVTPARIWYVRRLLRRHGPIGVLRLIWRKTFRRVTDRKALRRFLEHEQSFDHQYHIDTAGYIRADRLGVDTSSAEFAGAYQGIDPAVFEQLMTALPISHDQYTFIDIGSGKGRAVLLASRWPFRRVVGVELSGQLHHVARNNLHRFPKALQRCRNIALVRQDAEHYALPNENTVLFFYYPFDKVIMDRVVANVEASLAMYPRSIYLLLANIPYLVEPRGFAVLPLSVDGPFPIRLLHNGIPARSQTAGRSDS